MRFTEKVEEVQVKKITKTSMNEFNNLSAKLKAQLNIIIKN